MTIKYFALLTAIAMLNTSCDNFKGKKDEDQIKWQVVEADSFRIRVPDYMIALQEDINPDAEIFYGNDLKEIYAQVIIEDAEDVDAALEYLDGGKYSNGLEGYAEYVVDNLKESATTVSNLSSARNEKINYLRCKMYDFEADMALDEGAAQIYYSVNVVRGINNYYQFHTWTSTSKRAQYEELMKRILLSIEEKHATPSANNPS